MGSFADGLPATRPTAWAVVTNTTKTWEQRLSENKTPILFSVFLLLMYFAIQPLLRDQFFFADVFWARLLLTSASLALVPIFVSPLLSRFNLRLFEINRGPGGPWFPWRRILGYLAAMIVIDGVVYLVDPLRTYAQARTKAVGSIFYVTDRRSESTPNRQLIFGSLPNDRR